VSRLELAAIEGRLANASNITLLARDGEGGLWVYKPEQGERPLHDFRTGTLPAREVLTYEVSEALGIGVVPETVLASGPFGPGSAQRWLNEDEAFDARELLLPAPSPELWPVAVLDLVCNNADRKLGHLLREKETGRLWAIDNGLTFHHVDKLRTVMWGLAGEPIPEDLQKAVAGASEQMERGFARRVERLLSRTEARALAARMAALVADPVHPQPPTDRPAFPWPVW
jgi:hypothetical protein